jgi:hypothetical protein
VKHDNTKQETMKNNVAKASFCLLTLTSDSLSPMYLDMSEEAEMEKKAVLDSVATAFASIVLPQPWFVCCCHKTEKTKKQKLWR